MDTHEHARDAKYARSSPSTRWPSIAKRWEAKADRDWELPKPHGETMDTTNTVTIAIEDARALCLKLGYAPSDVDRGTPTGLAGLLTFAAKQFKKSLA